jgi:hypothetical protein
MHYSLRAFDVVHSCLVFDKNPSLLAGGAGEARHGVRLLLRHRGLHHALLLSRSKQGLSTLAHFCPPFAFPFTECPAGPSNYQETGISMNRMHLPWPITVLRHSTPLVLTLLSLSALWNGFTFTECPVGPGSCQEAGVAMSGIHLSYHTGRCFRTAGLEPAGPPLHQV